MPTTPATPAPDPARLSPVKGAAQRQPDVAFARHPALGLIAATGDDDGTGPAASVLRHFGFTLNPDSGVWLLPDRMLWVDQVLAAAQASALLTGFGHTVVADEETRSTALALAAQHTAPARSPGATLVQTPAPHTPAAHASAPRRR